VDDGGDQVSGSPVDRPESVLSATQTPEDIRAEQRAWERKEPYYRLVAVVLGIIGVAELIEHAAHLMAIVGCR
jgi:hypothetical protein